MSRPRRSDPKLVAKAQALVARASDAKELRAAQAVLLPALAHTTLEQTAVLLGVGRASVPRLQQRFREGITAVRSSRNWGGRRRARMTPEEETTFLAPWAEQARDAGVWVVSPVRAALAEKLGRKKVASSVVYRLLARHGWRKVAPDTRHPKSDPTAQDEWKKTPGNAGCPADTRIDGGPPSALDVSRRGSFRAQGATQAMLGAGSPAAGHP
ncbi:MAG: winged helix-turn-helix domain-containing protein [Blastocatellia bacterium]